MWCVLGLCLALQAVEPPRLSGQLLNDAKQPIPNALVAIWKAHPREGFSTRSPTGYDECRMRCRSDAEGRFEFPNVSSEYTYSLVAVADGYQGTTVDRLDPTSGPIPPITVPSMQISPKSKRLSGIILGENGKPMFGAYLRLIPFLPGGAVSNSPAQTSFRLLTDEQGCFEAVVAAEVTSLSMSVSAPNHASHRETIAIDHDLAAKDIPPIQLERGASIRGQLILHGDPLAHSEVCISQSPKKMIITEMRVHTDSQGFFQFDHLPGSTEYVLASCLGQASGGALTARLIDAPASGQLSDFGSIEVEAAHRLKVVVRTMDDSPVPESSIVIVSRSRTQDGLRLPLSPASPATVEIPGLGNEPVRVRAFVPGYRVVRTSPRFEMDINREYSLSLEKDTTFSVFLEKE